MTRISIYSKDVNVTGNDRWIGSDAQNQNRTKNFTPDNVATYFNENQVIDLGVELRYFYDTLDPLQERVFGSITFETEIGPQVNFSAISTFILSKYTMGHTDVSQFLDFLIGSNVLLSRSNNINMFGYYKIDNIEPYLPDPNFFVVTLTFDAGNGYMKEDEDYFISLIQFEQAAPVTPTLQSVTDAGNTTTTTVYLNGGAVVNSISGESVVDSSYVASTNTTTNSSASIDSTGILSLSSDGVNFGSIAVNDLTSSIQLQFPDKIAGIYTIATTDDMTLQGVVDNGNTVGNVLSFYSELNAGEFFTANGTLGTKTRITADGYIYFTNGLGSITSLSNTFVSNNNDFIFPNKPSGTAYTLATTADIPAAQLVALPFTTDHLTATNNAYVIGDVVWYLGNVYRCIANNDSILPTSTTYWTNLGAGNPLVEQPTDWNSTTGNNQILNKPTIPTGTVTSVGLTMPSAFSVANSPITSSGDIAVTGAGVVSQYVRGDGSLANFPTSTGGGASLSFYLNGSVSQGTIGGVAFREMDRTPILGAGTDFTIAANGYIQSFITDANVPNLLEIPAGNWNFETYFSASSNGGSPSFYLELYKWNGVTLSLIASNSANPEGITNGTAIDLYVSALAVPQTTLLATDRLAVRIYVTHSGRTIKLHTEDSHLCQVITTFSTGLTALNGLTTQVQSFATGTSGTDFAISSATSTHTFNLPTASAANRGALSSTDWSTFNNKFTLPALTSGSVLFSNGTTIAQDNANLFWDDTNNRLGIGTATPTAKLHIKAPGALSTDIALRVRNSADTGDLITINGLGGLNVTTSIGAANDRPISVGGSTGDIFYVRGFGDAFFKSNVFFGVLNGGNRISDGTILITSNQGTGTAFTTFTHNNNNIAFRILSNSVIQLNPIAGNVLVGSTTDAGFKLDVNGTARVSGNATFGTLGTGTGMFWDNTNNRLGIGTATPAKKLDVVGSIKTNDQIESSKVLNSAIISNTPADASLLLYAPTTAGNYGGIIGWAEGNVAASISAYDAGSGGALGLSLATGNNTSISERMRIFSNGNIGINTTTDAGYKLDVNGTARVSGTLSVKTTSGQQRIAFANADQIYIGLGANNNQIGANSSNRLFIGSEGDLPIYTLAGGTVIIADLANPASSASAKLRIDSTTQGFLPPRMTTTQKNAIATPAAGLMVYDTTLNLMSVYNGTIWISL